MFKKSKPKEENREPEVKKEEPVPEPAPAPAAEKNEPALKKAATKKEPAKKAPAKKEAAKKTASKKEPAKKAPVKKETAKKEAAKKDTEKKTSAKKETEKKSSSKKTSAKTAPKKKADEPEIVKMPPELKDLEKEMKQYAARIRVEYNYRNANEFFAEFMAQSFRDLGYKMVLVRDREIGLITMLGTETGDALKSKIAVLCRFMKKGSVDTPDVEEAQRCGSENRADETWCMTTTEFTASAVRKSRKPEAKVRLIDGKKLYKDFLSKIERLTES